MPEPALVPPQPTGYVSIAEAATVLDSKPWEVVRLIEAEKLESILLVEVASLHRFRERA